MDCKYEVIGVYGESDMKQGLGTFDDLRDAQKRLRELHDRGHMVYYDRVMIVRVSEEVVSVSEESQPTVDYERQGVRSEPDTEALREWMRQLEDRHVGLRHELGGDIDHVYEHIDELREQVDNLESASSTLRDDVLAYKEVTEELDAAMRHEVAGLRREMETLKQEVSGRILEHTTNFGGALENFETEVEKDMEALRSEIETLRNERKV